MKSNACGNVNKNPLNISLSGDLLIVVRSSRIQSIPGSTRGNVHEFSESSRRRLMRFMRECRAEYRVFLTLTYPPGFGENGAECKNHLRRFIQELKRYNERRQNQNGQGEWSALWFMEFQRSGRIHFHLFTTHRYAKEWVSRTWYRIVGSDEVRHLRAGTNIKSLWGGRDGARKYAAKYTYKIEQKRPPEGFGWTGRYWGVYGDRGRLSASTRVNPDMMGRAAIERQLFKLKAMLEEEKKRKTVEKLPQISDRAVVYHVSSARVRTMLVDWIMRTNILMYAASDKLAFWGVPELDESIDEDLKLANSMH